MKATTRQGKSYRLLPCPLIFESATREILEHRRGNALGEFQALSRWLSQGRKRQGFYALVAALRLALSFLPGNLFLACLAFSTIQQNDTSRGEDGEEHGEEVEGEDEEDQTEEEPEGEGEGEEEHTEEQVEGNAVLLVGVVAGAAVVTHAGGRAGAVAPPEKVWVKVLRCKGCDQALRKHSKEKTFVYEPADVACNHCSLYCGKCVGGHVEEAMKSRSKSIGCVEAECKCTFNDADFEALVEANVLPEKTYVDWLRNRVKGECCICLEDDPRNMVELACGHSFHINCLKLQLDAKWGGMRVTHQYMNCALCRSEIKAADSRTPQGKQLKKMILPHLQLRARVFRLCKKIALEDNHVKEEAKEEEIRKFVEEKMAVFTCNRCKEPYCGGLQDCGVEMKMKPEDLVCSDCSWKENHSQFKCREHGAQFAVYKCDCCCSLATFDCGGNHFCEWCHAHLDSKLGERPKCQGRECDKCPLGKPHPPNNPRTCGGYKGVRDWLCKMPRNRWVAAVYI